MQGVVGREHEKGRLTLMIWASLLIGIWLVLSPYILGFVSITAAFWNAVIFGVIAGIIALWSVLKKRRDASWLNVVVGIYLVLVPFSYGFSGNTVTLWNFLITGGILAITSYLVTTKGRPQSQVQQHH